MKVLLLIYTCKKYSFLYNDYINKYKNLGFDLYLVYGNPNLEEDCIIDQENNTYVLKCDDNFEGLPKKTYLMLKTFMECDSFSDYDYIIKMDDDTEFNFTLNELLNSNLLEGDYIGAKLISSEAQEHNYHFGKCSNIELNYTPYKLGIDLSWGAGYFYILSRKAIKVICEDIEGYEQLLTDNLYEDMMIGYILTNNNIEFKELFNKAVTTNLPRPRRLSINTNINTFTQNFNKISFNPKMSRIKKVTYAINKNSINCIDDIDDKIKKEVLINTELNKRINEMAKQIDIQTPQITPVNKNLQNEVKKAVINPIIQRSIRRVGTKVVSKRK